MPKQEMLALAHRSRRPTLGRSVAGEAQRLASRTRQTWHRLPTRTRRHLHYQVTIKTVGDTLFKIVTAHLMEMHGTFSTTATGVVLESSYRPPHPTSLLEPWDFLRWNKVSETELQSYCPNCC
jgi:hypothetical protein